jgi:hypothetical protein
MVNLSRTFHTQTLLLCQMLQPHDLGNKAVQPLGSISVLAAFPSIVTECMVRLPRSIAEYHTYTYMTTVELESDRVMYSEDIATRMESTRAYVRNFSFCLRCVGLSRNPDFISHDERKSELQNSSRARNMKGRKI